MPSHTRPAGADHWLPVKPWRAKKWSGICPKQACTKPFNLLPAANGKHSDELEFLFRYRIGRCNGSPGPAFRRMFPAALYASAARSAALSTRLRNGMRAISDRGADSGTAKVLHRSPTPAGEHLHKKVTLENLRLP